MGYFNKQKTVYDPRIIAKAIFVSAVIIVISMILSSCGTVMKRHYMKGYYVEKKHDKNSVVAINNTTANKQKTAPSPESKLIEVPVEVIAVEANKNKSEPAISKAKTGKKPVYAEPKITKNDNASEDFSIKETKRSPFNIRGVAEKLKGPDAATSDDVLSLFWIVILVILIIYVVSLFAITDLASAAWIHILGVIALVLLILWLLKVI